MVGAGPPVGAPGHVGEAELVVPALGEQSEEALGFGAVLELEVDRHRVPEAALVTERLEHLGPHQHMAREDRELDVQDHVLFRRGELGLVGRGGQVAHSEDRSDGLGPEHRAVEGEGRRRVPHEVEIGAHSGHRSRPSPRAFVVRACAPRTAPVHWTTASGAAKAPLDVGNSRAGQDDPERTPQVGGERVP